MVAKAPSTVKPKKTRKNGSLKPFFAILPYLLALISHYFP
jgi:hypothetical protein